MAVSDYSTTPSNNIAISGTDISENCAPAGMNNAIRQMMADIRANADTTDTAISDAVTDITNIEDRVETISLRTYGGVSDGATDDSTALDAALTAGWADYTTKYKLIIPHNTLLSKAGDFVVPPNMVFEGTGAGSKLIFGNAATRFYMKRDNTMVGTIGGVDYTQDGNYWGLGPNAFTNFNAVSATGVVVDMGFYVSDLPRMRFSGVVLDDGDFVIGCQFENDDKWCEFWYFDPACSFRGTTSGVEFTRTVGSTFESCGHGTYLGALHARQNGSAGIRVKGGASVYNGLINPVGFVSAPTLGQEAYLIKVEESGSDIRHTQINARVENINNSGTTYGIHVDTAAGADGSKIYANFTGVGSSTKYRGFETGRIRSTTTNRVDEDGTEVTGLSGIPMLVTPAADTNGDNILRYDGEQAFFLMDDAPVLNGRLKGVLPYISSPNARLVSFQINCEVAGSGNTGGGWWLGLTRQGSANPSYAVLIPDGSTTVTVPFDQQFPSGWVGLGNNFFEWSAVGGGGNDGIAPTGVSVLVHWFPGY